MLILRVPWIEVVKVSGEEETNDSEVVSHQTVIEELLQSSILDQGTLTWDSLLTTISTLQHSLHLISTAATTLPHLLSSLCLPPLHLTPLPDHTLLSLLASLVPPPDTPIQGSLFNLSLHMPQAPTAKGQCEQLTQVDRFVRELTVQYRLETKGSEVFSDSKDDRVSLEMRVLQEGAITVEKEGSGYKVIVSVNSLNEETAKDVAQKMKTLQQ
jgi:hypothetical protein